MQLYRAFADGRYHTSVLTTFGIDFGAYENIVLPRFRGAGCHNNIVIADHRMLAQSLGEMAKPPEEAGRLYSISSGVASAAFHPKVFLQVGRQSGRLILGSANLTTAGLAGNLELVNVVAAGAEHSGERELVNMGWAYLLDLLDLESRAVRDQLDWAQVRTPWLKITSEHRDTVTLADGTPAALLVTGRGRGIGEQFANRVTEPVKKLVVLSPYWDTKLEALAFLREALQPRETAILIDPATGAFPRDAVAPLDDVTLFHRSGFHPGRFIHAKLILAATEQADHVLVGSANCTVAALGKSGFAGANVEACLYRRLPPGTLLHALSLAGVLSPENTIMPEELPEYVVDSTPDETLSSNGATGTFEVYADNLTWRPAPSLKDPAACKLEVFDRLGDPVPDELLALPNRDDSCLLFRLSNTERLPASVKVRFPDGRVSSPAIVMLIDRLRSVRREAGPKANRDALASLDGMTELGLSFLEILEMFETNDAQQHEKGPSVSRAGAARDSRGESQYYQTLAYEDFIARSRPITEGIPQAHSSLAGSEFSIFRNVLNRIVGLRDTVEDHLTEEDSAEITQALSLGDETDDAERALETGSMAEQPVAADPGVDGRRAESRAYQMRKSTREQLVSTTRAFCERVKHRKHEAALGSVDLLRLRALLLVLCTAAIPAKCRGGRNAPEKDDLKVLPANADRDGWPRLIGILLFSFFGGTEPATRHLRLTDEHDQVPVDVLESWATCYWCFQVCLCAPIPNADRQKIDNSMMPLCLKAYRATGLTADELLGSAVIDILEALNLRYGERLGIDPEAVRKSHSDTVVQIFHTDE